MSGTEAMGSSKSGETAAQLAVIDRIFDELSQRARGDVTPDQFIPFLLERAVFLMDCRGTALWVQGPEETFLPIFEVDSRELLKSARGSLAPPVDSSDDTIRLTQSALSDELHHLMLWLTIPGESITVLSFFVESTSLSSSRESLSHLARALGEIYEEYVSGRRRHLEAERLRIDQQLDQLSLLLHRSLDLKYIACETANSARTILGVDRVAVARRRLGRVSIMACNGVATVQSRSAEVVALNRLVASVARMGGPLMLVGEMRSESAAVDTALQEYLKFHPQTEFLGVIPLLSSGGTQGSSRDRPVLVVQAFHGVQSGEVLNRINRLCQHLSVAWSQASRMRLVPLARVQMAVGQGLSIAAPLRLLKWPIIVGLLAAVGYWVWNRPAQMTMRIEGELIPRHRQIVFSPADGIIESLSVKQHAQVDVDTALVQLRSPDLEQRRQILQGEILSTLNRRDSLQIELNAESAASIRGEPSDVERIASQLRTAEQEIENRQRELTLMESEASKLSVTSPMRGTVVTWGIDQRLVRQRPVRTGDALLEIADLDGPWLVKLYVPDHRSAMLLAYLDQQKRFPEISFVTRTDSRHRYPARLVEIDEATTVRAGLGPVVRCEADVDSESRVTFRPGATVIASIDLGPSCLGEVYTHEFIETLRRNLFW